ncbi:hypothetical protein GpartN1_g3533.t1 [Galdieria partita]|uniref:Uncharacterized protein n=1 Tax=Galdieria partita TaxID=83374 RepID=A0A9C7PYB7_9RHOD|nr:hypothetical protein GpartN1_g3533.t1 [Galdieria partita]
MQEEHKQLSKVQEHEIPVLEPQEEKNQVYIYPEKFPERDLDKALQQELQNASELDPVLDAWYHTEDSDQSSSDVVELADQSTSHSSEEDECRRCRGLLEDKTYSSVDEALRDAAVFHHFGFEEELKRANLDIYGRIASVNFLRKLVYKEFLSAEETVKKWRDYIHNLGRGLIHLDTHLLQSYFRDDPLLQFAADYFIEEDWVD